MRSSSQLLVSVALACALCAAAGADPALAQTPRIAAVSPDFGPAAGGTSVRIDGSGFTPGVTVTFGRTPATSVEVLSATSLVAISPSGTGTIDVIVGDSHASSAVDSHDWFAYEAPAGGPWLGLNGDSDADKGPVNTFSRHGIVYDRSFSLTAGQLPTETEANGAGGTRLEDRLRYDHRYGMIPVASIQYRGYGPTLGSDPYFPRPTRGVQELAEGKTTISQYVAGFLRSAAALLRLVDERYPGMPVMLEAINEPWARTTPSYNGAQYAGVVAALLPAARELGIPASDIYVSAFGADQVINRQGQVELFAPGWLPAMYAAQPSLRSEVQGWYFHPYGPPSGTRLHDSWGIEAVPLIRRQMTSGENNIIVSEVGYCVSAKGACNESGAAEAETDAEAAALLTQMLTDALPYREAGWLKALIVYARGDGGWAMHEAPSERVNRKGEALIAFAQAHASSEAGESCSSARALGVDWSPSPPGPAGAPSGTSVPNLTC
jgi:hypothetical protein